MYGVPERKDHGNFFLLSIFPREDVPGAAAIMIKQDLGAGSIVFHLQELYSSK